MDKETGQHRTSPSLGESLAVRATGSRAAERPWRLRSCWGTRQHRAQGTSDRKASPLKHMRVELGRAHIGVAELLLHGKARVLPMLTLQAAEHPTHLLRGEHGGNAGPAPGPDHAANLPQGAAEHIPVDKDQRIERLILGAGRHAPLHGQMGVRKLATWASPICSGWVLW